VLASWRASFCMQWERPFQRGTARAVRMTRSSGAKKLQRRMPQKLVFFFELCSLCSRATFVSRRVLRLCVFFEVLTLARRSYCGRERCGAAQRAEALRAWRTLQHAAAPSTHEHASASQEAQKLLIVDLSFGGLSNRRQSLMLAAAAARLMRCVAWSSVPHAHRARGAVSPV
jgi:hypothetical protein